MDSRGWANKRKFLLDCALCKPKILPFIAISMGSSRFWSRNALLCNIREYDWGRWTYGWSGAVIFLRGCLSGFFEATKANVVLGYLCSHSRLTSMSQKPFWYLLMSLFWRNIFCQRWPYDTIDRGPVFWKCFSTVHRKTNKKSSNFINCSVRRNKKMRVIFNT